MEIRTNNVPRFTVDWYDLTEKERAQFDYLDSDTAKGFFRYRRITYDIGEFVRAETLFPDWHGFAPDSCFSGVVIRFPERGIDNESVIVGMYFA